MSTAAAAAPRSAAAALRARGRGGGASASRASPAPAPGRRRSVVVVDRGADDERLVTRRPRRRLLLPLLRATFDDGDGVPFFALSDASRASELRADADAIAALQTRRDAVLLPTTSGKSWVLEVRRARSGAGAGSDADAEDASFAESASFVAAEARLASLPDELLAGRDLSFMGFRGADGAPLFTTDVPSSADDDPMAYATRKAVADNYASMRRQRLQTGASAGEASLADVLSRIRVADAKAVGPMMSRDDAGVLAAAQALTSWQRNNKFCSRCGSPNKLVKSGHKAQCTRINDDKCRGAAYPTLMPAVLTLCTCGEYALLARNSKWPRGFYSCLAGFVDQSESLEQAAAREVIEESGIGIVPGSATYVASQPWPFPCQLMVGFRAEVAAIAVGGEERSDGAGAGEASLPASRSGAFYTLVPIRPRWRGERRSLRTLPGVSLRPHLAFNTRPRRLSTPSDAFELHPNIRLYRTALIPRAVPLAAEPDAGPERAARRAMVSQGLAPRAAREERGPARDPGRRGDTRGRDRVARAARDGQGAHRTVGRGG